VFLDIIAKVDVQTAYKKEKDSKEPWSCLNRNFCEWKQAEEVFGEYSGKCCHRVK